MTTATTTTATKVSDLFEREECPRCGGTGHYSYCQRYGTLCFECAGRQTRLTKRGHAAYQAYVAALASEVLIETVEIGDRIWFEGMGGRVAITVTESYHETELNQGRYWSVRGVAKNGGNHGISGFLGQTTVKRVTSTDERRAAFESVKDMPGVVAEWPS